MKRIIVICVTVMLLIALTACRGNTAVSNTGSEKSTATAQIAKRRVTQKISEITAAARL